MLTQRRLKTSSKRFRVSLFEVALLTLFCLAAILRFYRLTHHSFWYDEGLSLMRSDGQTLAEVLATLNKTSFDKYQPTYFIGLFFWRRLIWRYGGGDSSLLCDAGFGVNSDYYPNCPKLFGRHHALWTAALMTVSAYHVYYSQEARAYSLVMLLAALQLLLFSPLLMSGRRCSRDRVACFWLVTTLAS
jgi:uncharacterized membrane protein